MIRLGIILTLICINCYAQTVGVDNLKYATSEDINSFDYDNELRQIAESSQVIGLGEATHGTADFEELRTEIIKLFVTEYGYRHIILEASYTQSMALNEYINTGKNNPKEVLSSFVFWPFATEGMYNLLHWLKEYNTTVPPEQRVQFYGMDRYGKWVYRYVKIQEERYGEVRADNGWIDTSFFGRMEMVEGSEKEKNKQYEAMLEEQKKVPENLIDSIAKTNIIRSYILHNISHGGKRHAYREDFIFDMASVLIDSFFKNEKGIIYAHNTHVSKKSSARKTLGNMLYDKYGDKYKVIGTELKGGTARAKVLTDGKYIMSVVNIVEQPQTLGYRLSHINKGVLGIDCNINKGSPIVDRKQHVNSFGALYSFENTDKLYTDNLILSKSFNYLFIIDATSPTESLIKKAQ